MSRGAPGYTGSDLIADAVGVLDAYGIQAAHVVGVSAGGAFAQLLALDYPDARPLARPHQHIARDAGGAWASIGDRALPSFRGERGGGLVGSRASVIDYLVGLRARARRRRAPVRRGRDASALVGRDVERAHNIAASENHAALPEGVLPHAPLSSIAVPTLVIHGTADPMFPLEHGQALAEEVPGARLLTLDGAGHGVDRADWETIVRAILEHTARTERRP